LRADTNARAGAERHERETRRRRRVGHEPSRDERGGIRPVGVMPMQDPRRDHDDRAARQIERADPVGENRFSHERKRRRKEAQCFVHHRPGADQFRLDAFFGQVDAAQFLGHPVLIGFRTSQQHASPEQRDRGRFVTGENQCGDLIA